MSTLRAKEAEAFRVLKDAVKDMLPFFKDKPKVEAFLRVQFPNIVLNDKKLVATIGTLRGISERGEESNQEDVDEDDEEEEEEEEEVVDPQPRSGTKQRNSTKVTPKSTNKQRAKEERSQRDVTPTPSRRKHAIGTPGSKGTAEQFASVLGHSKMEMPATDASPTPKGGSGRKRALSGFDDVVTVKKSKASPIKPRR